MGNCVKAEAKPENYDAEVAASPHFSQVMFAQKLGKHGLIEGINDDGGEDGGKGSSENDPERYLNLMQTQGSAIRKFMAEHPVSVERRDLFSNSNWKKYYLCVKKEQNLYQAASRISA